MKKDALLDKSTVLDEVSQLTDALRGEAADGRATGAQLAAAANSYQQKLRAVTRKMMATISELSLYQVSSSLFMQWLAGTTQGHVSASLSDMLPESAWQLIGQEG
eukprot:GHUV01045688.1.p3 GENE.GHUV01045688.1~~GHUV01045688.1.p3  ORF type:complete len:105 (+),score=27.97 GHUV01045688.1:182-496(+)